MNSANPDQEKLKQWFYQQSNPVLSQNQRVVCVLSGSKRWSQDVIQALIPVNSDTRLLTVSLDLAGTIPPEKSRSQLGKEYETIVFDAHDRFEPDALGAVSGTLRGGGILFLLIPGIDDWPLLSSSRFLQRAISLLINDPAVVCLQQGQSLPAVREMKFEAGSKQSAKNPFLTCDQQNAVETIERKMLAKSPAPVVLVSDRGRGKSAALGFAAARLLKKGVGNIIVTAPRLSTSDPVFKHAQQLIPGATTTKGELLYQQAALKFIAPDALLDQQQHADVLLIDEAAAIPVPMLEKLLHQYPAVVFATTIHGYEGTGRGFVLKFYKVLDAFNPDWQLITLQTPIRWAEHDPMERCIDRLLCLDAELPELPPVQQLAIDHCQVKCIDRDQLVKDEQTLSSLFALLVYAHYRTQPSDLQHMLDDPGVRVYTLEHQHKIIAALLINQEGGFDKALSSEIYQGLRRPPGHLLAQTLTLHAGVESAATLAYARIMRIAVHPQLQGNGFGSHLLAEVVKQEQQLPVDAIGASFGSTVELLRFWQHAGFELVRMGFTRDHASGTHSAVMIKPLTEAGQSLLSDLQQRFQRSLADWLSDSLRDLPDSMRDYLQQQVKPVTAELTVSDWQDIDSFISTHRGYEGCMGAIRRLLKSHAGLLEQLNETEQQLVNARALQGINWDETVKLTGLTGKSQALQQLRLAIKKIVNKLK